MEKEDIKVYVVGRDYNYNFLYNSTIVNNIEDADVVIFTGGEDVDPIFYNCDKHKSSYCNYSRDLREIAEFNKTTEKQLLIGVCRGSQFLTVMNGGLLVQDVNNHAISGTHSITNGKKEFNITSTHHQMHYPYVLDEKDYTILYYASPSRSDKYLGDRITWEEGMKEPEITLYHKEDLPKCLAIQGHPEMMTTNCKTVQMLNKLVNDLLKTIK